MELKDLVGKNVKILEVNEKDFPNEYVQMVIEVEGEKKVLYSASWEDSGIYIEDYDEET